MKILCLFTSCKWIYIGNGLYQCSRCKSVSLGADRDKQYSEPKFSTVKSS